MFSLTIALLVAFLASGAIVHASRGRSLPWDDGQLSGAQKFHAHAVPRVGGLALALGLFVLLLYAWQTGRGPTRELGLVLICGLPPLVAGLLEDITKKVGIKTRLLATAAGGVLAFFLLGAQFVFGCYPVPLQGRPNVCGEQVQRNS